MVLEERTMPETTQAPETYDIREGRFHELLGRVVRMNRRSERCGTLPIGIEKISERLEDELFPNDQDRYLSLAGKPTGRKFKVYTIKLTGETPVVAGWAFVARLQHTEAGNIVSRAPKAYDVVLPESYWTAEPACDHCRTRRARHDTFVLLETETGALRQVGRNCLADYLRNENVASAVRMWGLIDDVREFLSSPDREDDGFLGGGDGGGRRVYEIERVLGAAAAAIRQHGWVSTAAAREAEDSGVRKDSTASRVHFILCPPGRNASREVVREWIDAQPTDEDKTEAEKALAWCRALVPTSDYERNLHVATALPIVDPRNVGIVVSGVAGYQRSVRREAERLIPQANNEHVGEIGKRLRGLKLRVESSRIHEGEFRTSTIVKFVDDAGHRFVWFASGVVEAKAGQDFTVTGTVRRHAEYRGTKETVLNRCQMSVVLTS